MFSGWGEYFTWPPGLTVPAAFAGQENGQVIVIMAVAVADATIVDDHRVVQERVLALANGLELAQEVRELLNVEAVDLLDLLVLSGIAAVVREVMVAFGDADERVRAVWIPRWRT